MRQDVDMGDEKRRAERRSDALSETRIIQEAVAILDEGGVGALTFRRLAARLSTGPGAIYHHVASKDDLIAGAVDAVMAAPALARDDIGPRGVETVLMSAFDAIESHRWVGAQLASTPWQPAVLLLFDRVGSGLGDRGVPSALLFDAASVLVHFVVGVASQYHAAAGIPSAGLPREAFLEQAAKDALAGWSGPHPFTKQVAGKLISHDDREQFRAGVNIILAGIDALARGVAVAAPAIGDRAHESQVR